MWQNELTHLVSLSVYNVPGRDTKMDAMVQFIPWKGRDKQRAQLHTK